MARAKGKQKKNIQHKAYLPWVEKYRPRNIDEIAHQTHVISTLKNVIQSANLTHLLFYGPPGTGKTSTILALSRQLYGPNLMKSRVLELNASDERGINVVRTKIKNFAQYTVNNKSKEPGYPCPPYKIIILDEADSMTRDAQTALRRTMEKWSNITRFCLICNYVSRIITPVASRCSKFRFQLLNRVSMYNKLKEISTFESVKILDNVLNEIIAISSGDMRKSITLLQTASLMKSANEYITIDDVLTVTVRIPDNFIDKYVFSSLITNSFSDINNITKYIIAEGYPVSLILPKLIEYIMNNDNLFNNLSKAKIAIYIAEADKKLVDGASEFLQLLSVLGFIAQNMQYNVNDNNNNNDDDNDFKIDDNDI